MNDYRVTFSADAGQPLDVAAAERLAEALDATPGTGRVETVAQDGDAQLVSAAFWLQVRLGMADAARDGSRLAKEALKSAGMPDAQLVELGVSLHRDEAAAP